MDVHGRLDKSHRDSSAISYNVGGSSKFTEQSSPVYDGKQTHVPFVQSPESEQSFGQSLSKTSVIIDDPEEDVLFSHNDAL